MLGIISLNHLGRWLSSFYLVIAIIEYPASLPTTHTHIQYVVFWEMGIVLFVQNLIFYLLNLYKLLFLQM